VRVRREIYHSCAPSLTPTPSLTPAHPLTPHTHVLTTFIILEELVQEQVHILSEYQVSYLLLDCVIMLLLLYCSCCYVVVVVML
jgi:hypothetical protein